LRCVPSKDIALCAF